LLGDAVTLVDSAENCATALRDLLRSEGLNAGDATTGQLQVALTDPPDAFLQIADKALDLDVGDIQLRQL
jgi:glutamate racemase